MASRGGRILASVHPCSPNLKFGTVCGHHPSWYVYGRMKTHIPSISPRITFLKDLVGFRIWWDLGGLFFCFYVNDYFACMFVCVTTCLKSACGGRNRKYDSLELELQSVMSLDVAVKN